MSTNKTADFHVRMTPEERDRFDVLAGEYGMTRSELVRLLVQLPTDVIDEANVRAVYVDRFALVGIRRELRRFGTNMNQATHALNAISLFLRRGKLRQEFLEEQAPLIQEQLASVSDSQKEIVREFEDLKGSIFLKEERCLS